MPVEQLKSVNLFCFFYFMDVSGDLNDSNVCHLHMPRPLHDSNVMFVRMSVEQTVNIVYRFETSQSWRPLLVQNVEQRINLTE